MTAKSTKQATDKATQTVESVVAVQQEAMQSFVKAGAENYEKAFDNMRAKAEEMMKNYDDFALNGKDAVDAFVAAGTAYTKGVEEITSEWMAFAKSAMEQNVTATKAVMGAKTLQEMMDLQMGFARASFDDFVARSTKVGELATKTAQETIEPISSRVTTFVEKAAKAA